MKANLGAHNVPNKIDKKEHKINYPQLHNAMDGHFKQLCSMGVGVQHTWAQVITLENENKLWSIGSLGTHSPKSLLNTVFFFFLAKLCYMVLKSIFFNIWPACVTVSSSTLYELWTCLQEPPRKHRQQHRWKSCDNCAPTGRLFSCLIFGFLHLKSSTLVHCTW